MLGCGYCALQHARYITSNKKKILETSSDSSGPLREMTPWLTQHCSRAASIRVYLIPAFDAHLSLWRMIRDALAEARQAQVEREIENYLACTAASSPTSPA